MGLEFLVVLLDSLGILSEIEGNVQALLLGEVIHWFFILKMHESTLKFR